MGDAAISFEEVVIAAWLHDVGKFAQRAGLENYRSTELEGYIAKIQKNGRYSHQLYTHGFLERHKDVFPDEINVRNVINLASAHHSPSSYEEWLVAQADRLSSGSDRCNVHMDEGIASRSDEKAAAFYECPMVNVISTVGNGNKTEYRYLPMKPLEKDAILFPGKEKISRDEYNQLWMEFEKDYQALKGLSVCNFLQSLDALFMRYAWCIPSATDSKDNREISLYQHSKTTAAFAAALYRFHENDERLRLEEQKVNTDGEKFLFVCGDVSGIQKYIFELHTSADNAKFLRAKSFQVAALGTLVSKYIVENCGVCEANIITAAGGKCILLLPNTKKIREELLPAIRLEVESFFLSEFAGKLSFVMSDGVKASYADCQHENIRKLLNAIGYDAEVAKQHKMQNALRKNGHVLSGFYDALQKNGVCPHCGVFASEGLDEENKPKPCGNCSALTDIGGRLVKANTKKLFYETGSLKKHFGQMVRLREKSEAEFGYAINEYTPGLPLSFSPYEAPQCEDGNLLTFEDIAHKSCGVKKLAMLKADVDNLGFLFSSCFGGKKSFSRYADLSFFLNYFFSAYYFYFVSKHPVYKDAIYTVFSGGDDLCLIGPWNVVMDFARDFHSEFIRFTGGDADVSLSAGIVLFDSKLPVRDSAKNAQAALEKSKSKKAKNSVTVFDTTVSWQEFADCIADGEILYKNMGADANGQNNVSSRVVYALLDLAARAEKVKNGNVAGLLHNYTWMSHFAYLISRNIKDETFRGWFGKFGVNPESMIRSRIAVSYALYKNREK